MTGQKPRNHTGRLPGAGDVIDDRYRLGHPIASGGMGVIVKAEQLRTGRTVVVKLLHPHIAQQDNFAERFAREVQVATLFDHSNIVRVYDVGKTEQGALYLVMEHLEGEDLKELIARQAPMTAGEVLDLGLQIVDGLAEAHAQQVVHRDIKPANVFVIETRRGTRQAKLLDFGLAKLLSTGTSDLTATGVYAGTPAYIAPETLVSSLVSDDSAVDVYAAGLVILEMLTGEKVFDGDTIPQTLIQHLKKPVRIPARLAKTSLGQVLKVATEKHPGNRYADADQFYEALERASHDTDRSLRLTRAEIPRGQQHTSPSLLNRVAHADAKEGLDVLQNAPRHQIYVPDEVSPGSASGVTTELGLDDVTEKTVSLTDDDLVILDDSEATAVISGGEEATTLGATTPAEEATPSQLDRSTASGSLPGGLQSLKGRFSTRPLSIGASVVVLSLVAMLAASAFVVIALSGDDDSSAPAESSQADSSLVPETSKGTASADEKEDVMRPEGAEIGAGEAGDTAGDEDAPRITVRIDTDPSNAAVYADGRKVGYTVLDAEFDDGAIPNVLSIEKEGYETETWDLGAEFEARDEGEPMTLSLRMRLQEAPKEPDESASPSQASGAPPPQPSTSPPPAQPAATGHADDDDDDDDDDVDDMLRRYLD